MMIRGVTEKPYRHVPNQIQQRRINDKIRQWIIENDWLEAIIALPDQLFYNTAISTYIWILNNHKSEKLKDKIQLTNATGAKEESLIKAGERDSNRFWEKMPCSLATNANRDLKTVLIRALVL